MAKLGSKPIDELVRRAIIGDGAAFTELWDTNFQALYSYLRATFSSLDDFFLDDICSRSFEKAFRQINSYDPAQSRFFTWLKVIAHNTALDTIDQEKRRQKGCVPLDVDPEDAPMGGEVFDSEEESPLDAIIHNEEQETTLKYIEGLPELYRTVARLRLVEGLQYKEIAEETGLELNTVRTRIRRAKTQIEKMKSKDN